MEDFLLLITNIRINQDMCQTNPSNIQSAAIKYQTIMFYQIIHSTSHRYIFILHHLIVDTLIFCFPSSASFLSPLFNSTFCVFLCGVLLRICVLNFFKIDYMRRHLVHNTAGLIMFLACLVLLLGPVISFRLFSITS